MSNKKSFDFAIIGGGIIGLCIAKELKTRFPDAGTAVFEKEYACGLHGSGRNSGVLHAGFYYSSDSLKARFCRDGNKALTRYCLERKIPVNRCGKLVVAQNEHEISGLEELYKRGKANRVDLQMISVQEARKIEPRVKTFEKAVFSPSTSTTDPARVVEEIAGDLVRSGVSVYTGAKYLSRQKNTLKTAKGDFEFGYLINAAGLYADKIAKDFGFSRNYKMLPFKGIYLYSSEPQGNLKTNIYPVPDLKFPFLGVHFTLTVDGKNKIGPTAIPAFWREHYKGLENFKLNEMMEVMTTELGLFLHSNFGFRRLAFHEIKKYFRPVLVSKASKLLEGVNPANYLKWGTPGIRAQLYDVKKRNLVMDFCIEHDEKSCHVLNAVSPAFTCAMPFAGYVVDEISKK
ncbi:MAG: L-2-hydroxyglutarate oxidase [Elusimicrobia bacterium]|nr:L-2-hydroxyglutarate oxidase [Elusimicrobiota bacterium]